MPAHEERNPDPANARSESPQSQPAEGEAPREHAAARQQAPAGVQSVQPEDPSLTGASAPLQRELLGLNAHTTRKDGRKAEGQPPSETPTGLHSTGHEGNAKQGSPDD